MIVIPAAGQGSRFAEAGYRGPKHLLPLGGKTMIEWVIDNVKEIAPDDDVLVADRHAVGETRGAVETVHRALTAVQDEERVIVANCDQLLKFPETAVAPNTVFTFPSNDAAHSYVVTKPDDLIWDIKEKLVISDRAVSGVYTFDHAANLRDACAYVMKNMGGELYLSSALRALIDWGHQLYAVDAPTAILGTPEDFQRFEVALQCAA